MAKEPNLPTNDGNTTDDRHEVWETQFFGSDGSLLGQEEPLESEPSEPELVGKPEPADPAADSNPALAKRLANTASQAAQDKADDLGDLLHTKFMQLLNDKVRDTDGHLTPADITEMGNDFRDSLDGIKTAFLEAVESYTLAREKNRIDQTRGNLFQRLMVKKFESQFIDEKALQDRPEFLSRRMLPGFFIMVTMMFGEPKLADFERRTNKMIDQLRIAQGGQLEWDDVYKSSEARKITLLAEVEIAQHFREYEKRLEWMVAMVNSNLISLDESPYSTPWVFNQRAAINLLTELFRDLSTALDSPNTRKTFIDRLGNETVGILDTVILRIN